jgi:hypothetical protein
MTIANTATTLNVVKKNWKITFQNRLGKYKMKYNALPTSNTIEMVNIIQIEADLKVLELNRNV